MRFQGENVLRKRELEDSCVFSLPLSFSFADCPLSLSLSVLNVLVGDLFPTCLNNHHSVHSSMLLTGLQELLVAVTESYCTSPRRGEGLAVT